MADIPFPGSSAGDDADVLLEARTQEPPRYAVYLHNDDYTSMDFVVQILQTVFFKTKEEAMAIMLQVHHEGSARCGAYTREVAETKVRQVFDLARGAGFPLQCTMERE